MIADIGYIMSCSNDEFEQVTGVRLSEDAWDRWSDDMDRRTEQLLMLFEKAVAEEREKRQRYEALVTGMTNLLELQQKRESTVIDMIAAGVVAEREACAKLAYEILDEHESYDFGVAAAIRARGNT
jgi:DNA-binding SARP family transcriptional activator